MALMGWKAAYIIAARRDQTKRGNGHLTDHALDVINQAAERDQDALIQAMVKGQLAGLLRR